MDGCLARLVCVNVIQTALHAWVEKSFVSTRIADLVVYAGRECVGVQCLMSSDLRTDVRVAAVLYLMGGERSAIVVGGVDTTDVDGPGVYTQGGGDLLLYIVGYAY